MLFSDSAVVGDTAPYRSSAPGLMRAYEQHTRVRLVHSGPYSRTKPYFCLSHVSSTVLAAVKWKKKESRVRLDRWTYFRIGEWSVVCNTEGKETIRKSFMDSADLKYNDIRADHMQRLTEYSNTARNLLCVCYTKHFEVSLS